MQTWYSACSLSVYGSMDAADKNVGLGLSADNFVGVAEKP
jgi:hypothetical protein